MPQFDRQLTITRELVTRERPPFSNPDLCNPYRSLPVPAVLDRLPGVYGDHS